MKVFEKYPILEKTPLYNKCCEAEWGCCGAGAHVKFEVDGEGIWLCSECMRWGIIVPFREALNWENEELRFHRVFGKSQFWGIEV